MQFCAEAPGKIWGQEIGSLDPRGGRLARIRWRSRPGEGSGSTTCSPRVGWRPWFGRRSRRPGCPAMAGSGGPCSGEGIAHGWKCEACGGAIGPKGCVGLSDQQWGQETTRAHGSGGNGGQRVGGRAKPDGARAFIDEAFRWRRRDAGDAAIAQPSRPARVRRCAADGLAVRGAHQPVRRGPWRARGRGFPDLGKRRLGKPRGLGRHATSGGRASGGARARGCGVAARHRGARRGRPVLNLLSPSLNRICSKNLNRSGQNFQY
jgi:hypothetical protein